MRPAPPVTGSVVVDGKPDVVGKPADGADESADEGVVCSTAVVGSSTGVVGSGLGTVSVVKRVVVIAVVEVKSASSSSSPPSPGVGLGESTEEVGSGESTEGVEEGPPTTSVMGQTVVLTAIVSVTTRPGHEVTLGAHEVMV